MTALIIITDGWPRGLGPSERRKILKLIFLRKYQDIQVAKQHSSFTEVAEQFLAHNRSQIKASSYRDKCSILKKVNSTIGAKKISLITHETLRKLFKQYEGAYTKNYVSKIYYTVNEV